MFDVAFQYMYYKMIITRSEVFENSENGLFWKKPYPQTSDATV